MKTVFTFFIFLFLNIFAAAQTAPYFLKIDYPEFIPVNSSFEISAVAKLTDVDTDTLELYLFSDDDISVQKLICRSFLESDDLEVIKTAANTDYKNTYVAKINLEDWKLGNSIFFQLTFLLNNENYSAEIEKNLALGISLGEEEDENLQKQDFSFNDEDYFEVPVKFYNPQRISGNSLVIDEKSKIDFTLKPETEVKNLLIEFWAKFSNADLTFFNILNKETKDTLLSLGDNFYQMLSVKGIEEQVIYEDFFLSDDSWNHISVYISPKTFRAEVYANDKILFAMPLNHFSDFRQLNFELTNNTAGKAYQIDLLKIWDFNNHLDLSFRNKNYITFNADSSQLLAGFTFDDLNKLSEQAENNFLKIKIDNPVLENSNAPIFSQAPKLNIEVYNDFYSLEWKNQESELPKEFTLEKSIDGKSYFPIFTIAAEEDKKGNYVYTDPKDITSELVYYRVKQLNLDDSEIYSSPVKIGQGQQENFILDQNYPNPFNPKTIINVEILKETEIEVNIYNLVGMKVAKIYDGKLSQGTHKFTFDGSNQPSGIYFCEVKSPSATQVRKMILTK